MLTQGPAPDPKCKFNISSFLTLPHPSVYLICANDVMIIVLFLQIMGGWEGWGWFIDVRVWVGGQGGHHIFYFFVLFFVLLLFLHGWYMILVVSVSLFVFCFLCLWSL